jgi:hypothetical protein
LTLFIFPPPPLPPLLYHHLLLLFGTTTFSSLILWFSYFSDLHRARLAYSSRTRRLFLSFLCRHGFAPDSLRPRIEPVSIKLCVDLCTSFLRSGFTSASRMLTFCYRLPTRRRLSGTSSHPPVLSACAVSCTSARRVSSLGPSTTTIRRLLLRAPQLWTSVALTKPSMVVAAAGSMVVPRWVHTPRLRLVCWKIVI